jgi:hypothetical protein
VPLWVDASEVSGAIAASLAFLGGIVISAFYGRKANVVVTGEAHLIGDDVFVSTRPSISAVGFYRLKFASDDGAYVRVTEVYQIDGKLHNGRYWEAEAIFGASFVEGGETLTTTVIFPLGTLPPEVVGWRCSFGVKVVRFPRSSKRWWAWADQNFIPRPDIKLGRVQEKEVQT